MHTLATRAQQILPSPGLFRQANIQHEKSYPGRGFTTYPAQHLPSQWATQIIGQNLLLSLGAHLHKCMIKPNKKKATKEYATAATFPHHITEPLLPSHFFLEFAEAA